MSTPKFIKFKGATYRLAEQSANRVVTGDTERDHWLADELFSVIDNNESLYLEKQRLFQWYKRKGRTPKLPDSFADLVRSAADYVGERTNVRSRQLAAKEIIEEYLGWLSTAKPEPQPAPWVEETSDPLTGPV